MLLLFSIALGLYFILLDLLFFCRSCREYGHGGGNRDYGQRCMLNSTGMLTLLPLPATDDDDVIGLRQSSLARYVTAFGFYMASSG